MTSGSPAVSTAPVKARGLLAGRQFKVQVMAADRRPSMGDAVPALPFPYSLRRGSPVVQVTELVRSEVPVVSIDYAFDGVSAVMSDNMEGGYQLASYLIRMGHRRIAFIHGETTSVTRKRLVGFNRALQDNGIRIPESYLVQGRYHDADISREATRALMSLTEPPTAILYPDDFSYLGGMIELERMGLRIPEDISVAGYDGIQLAHTIRPKLTTYYQDADMIGRLAARKLVETIEHRRTCAAEAIQVSGKLLEGSSVKQLSQ